MNEVRVNTYPAGFFVRAAAYGTDLFILALALLIPRIIAFFAGGEAVLFRYTVWDIILYFLGKTYFVLTTYYNGGTPGKRMQKLVVTDRDGNRPEFLTVLFRETVGRYLSAFFGIGYFMIALKADKTALHDRICDTRVVYRFEEENAFLPEQEEITDELPLECPDCPDETAPGGV